MKQPTRTLLLLLLLVLKSSHARWTYNDANTRMEWNELPSHIHLSCNDHINVDDDDLVVVVVGSRNQNATDSMLLLPTNLTLQFGSPVLDRLASELTHSTTSSGQTSNTIATTSNSNSTQRLVFMTVNDTTSNKDARDVGTALASLVINKHKSASKLAVVFSFQQQDYHATGEFWTQLLTALYMGLYRDERYKSHHTTTVETTTPKLPRNIEFGVSNRTLWNQAHDRATIYARAQYLSRDIVQAPHNSLNSLSLADTARRLAQRCRFLHCRIYNTDECEARGMGSFLGVARGSETPPQFIHLTYQAPSRRYLPQLFQTLQRRRTTLALIGKGLLFDTGGYNIKTSTMEHMKFDCGGAAAVLGAAYAIAQLQPPNVTVHFLMAACENMINERAMVPSDILVASNGKTIEVANTDAEGRLTLADALVYADRELGCDEIVELSTLTGACVVALGSSMAGLWTKNDDLAQRLLRSSEVTGEKIWRMPFNEEDYGELIKSKIADIKNLGSRFGGAISAALFLQQFVDGDKPFAHIDMAGPVWNYKDSQASGWGAMLATDYVCSSSASVVRNSER